MSSTGGRRRTFRKFRVQKTIQDDGISIYTLSGSNYASLWQLVQRTKTHYGLKENFMDSGYVSGSSDTIAEVQSTRKGSVISVNSVNSVSSVEVILF
jgi:hypothetical protein